MWLPKDERRLLAGYYTLIGEIGTKKVYHLARLAPLLRFRGHRSAVPEYGESGSSSGNSGDVERLKRRIAQLGESIRRIKKGNSLLAARALITVTPHRSEINVVVISLSVDGYDLGRRYSNLLESSRLWFQEYRKLIIAVFGGAMGVKLIDWIASLISGREG